MSVNPSDGAPELRLWPAHLPPGARWLPYSPELVRASPALRPPASPAAPIAAARQLWPIPYWRLLLVASLGAGLIGIGGGMILGFLFGGR
ncbi:MAG: hypothetical protein E6J53_09915 [Chloroflexi bacterium]|nr:MAG: hypothetical protein E6J53_09915 [Chloroflexota bacterium]